ncbi:hypothetical protein FGE12_12675 [Aggregicoccus sp. 17bor-14]|uniref:HEAT repeat domain-containing protein n=1 Tax=Myxococcaceae TaxID=31 RepID=UPI00129C35AE|nr:MULTISPECIES: HEAT repeat domain-containing protein [Myxococcaceae]MBF5043246.1 HEAT repeat domain-containing protein [Simulacricoccus sp. 17bor-14]MRI89003.1 hypothetical protein [Aggregicoccus sp. 17bor-14]
MSRRAVALSPLAGLLLLCSPLAARASAPPPRERYAGSQVCADCHEDEHAAWGKDWHARALSPATAKYVVGDFAGAHFKGASSEAWMNRSGPTPVMRTLGTGGALADYPVQWVVGGKRMQDPVTVLPDGRWQVLPIYFHVTGKGEWVDYSEQKQGALTPDHPFFWANFRRNAQQACLDCHTTGLDVRYDRAAHLWSTKLADAGVACESCHGPGARHADTQEAKDIVNPKRLSREAGLAVCAQCHGPRWTLFPILDAAHHYRPGERYEDHYQPMVVTLGNERSGDFFPDGRPSTSSFEYQALLQSACYRKGGATCLTCHTAPHVKSAPDEVKLAKHAPAGASAGAETCRSCHAAVFAQGQKHTHHTAQAAQDCLACHMPPTVSGVLDHFADHALDVPNPTLTAKHGEPNACGVCHAKETPEALAQQLATLWPGAEARQQRRLRLADAFDAKTARDSRPALEAVLADGSEAPSLRGVAAQLLAFRFRRESVPALLAALPAKDATLRSIVAEALGTARAGEAAPALAPLLKDPSLWVRQNAALALHGLGDARGTEALRTLAKAPASTGLVQPHIALGQAAAQQRNWSGAAQEFERALDLQPYNADLLVMLADMYARQEDWPRAKAQAEEALRFNPQHAGAKRRVSALQAQGPRP